MRDNSQPQSQNTNSVFMNSMTIEAFKLSVGVDAIRVFKSKSGGSLAFAWGPNSTQVGYVSSALSNDLMNGGQDKSKAVIISTVAAEGGSEIPVMHYQGGSETLFTF